MPSAAALTVADRISDPMMPELDPSLLDFRPMDIDFGASKKDDPMNWNSQVLSDPLSVELGRREPQREERAEFDEEDDMNIDLDLDLGFDDGPSIEIGRRAPRPLEIEEELGIEDGVQGVYAYEEDTRTRLSSLVPSLIEDRDDDLPDNTGMLLDDDVTFPQPHENGPSVPSEAADPRLQRDSQSPLSSLRSSLARGFDATNLEEGEEDSPVQQIPQRAKRRKVIHADADTMLTSAQIKQQQADRSAILKPASLLARDPLLLSLMIMQKNGEFVTRIMGDGRTKAWAPELREILSVGAVRKAGELKRKRDSGIADIGDNGINDGVPQLEIDEDETLGVAGEGLGPSADATIYEQPTIINLPPNDCFVAEIDDGDYRADEDADDYDAAKPHINDTDALPLHPLAQGAVSQGTKHAVHLLRDRLDSAVNNSSSQQRKSNILFQDMLPQATTSKADATKMFFEVLVLATKDAVKVEQANEHLGSSLRICAKRGLYGTWAETEAGGEIENQQNTQELAI